MKELVTSIYNRKLEIHYNEWFSKTKEGKKIKMELKGKIKCPVLNESISSMTCSVLMDKNGWPRNVCPTICSECNCFIHLSIAKFKNKNSKE